MSFVLITLRESSTSSSSSSSITSTTTVVGLLRWETLNEPNPVSLVLLSTKAHLSNKIIAPNVL